MSSSYPDRSRHRLIAVLGAILFVALVVFSVGLISFLTDTDLVIVERAGPWPGIGSALFAAFVCGGMLLYQARQQTPVLRAAAQIAGAVAVVHFAFVLILLFLLVGGSRASAPTLGDLTFGEMMQQAGHLITGWYSVGVFVAAFITILLCLMWARADPESLRWPWEKEPEDDE